MAGVLGGHRYFSSSYDEARSRFRSACERHGAQQEALALDLQGPSGEALTIDLAWFGPRDAKRVVVTSSGTHGIEGYMGSAAQLAVLDRDLTLPAGVALLMIHAVNPYGFAFRRRVNEDNIDQNRNFLLAGEAYAGCPQGYHALNAMLNPTRAPKRRLSAPAFIARAVGRIARAGLGPLKGAVAGGQYTYPLGVFYGGSEPSRSMRAPASPSWRLIVSSPLMPKIIWPPLRPEAPQPMRLASIRVSHLSNTACLMQASSNLANDLAIYCDP